jgi:hypothetical protein
VLSFVMVADNHLISKAGRISKLGAEGKKQGSLAGASRERPSQCRVILSMSRPNFRIASSSPTTLEQVLAFLLEKGS